MNKRTLLAITAVLFLMVLLVTGLMLMTNRIITGHLDVVFSIRH